MRQYVTSMQVAWEQVRIIKRYRTPLSTRAFSRIFIWAHPFIMGPYYAYIAGVGSAAGTDVGFATAHAAITSLALCALLNARYQLEVRERDHSSLEPAE